MAKPKKPSSKKDPRGRPEVTDLKKLVRKYTRSKDPEAVDITGLKQMICAYIQETPAPHDHSSRWRYHRMKLDALNVLFDVLKFEMSGESVDYGDILEEDPDED